MDAHTGIGPTPLSYKRAAAVCVFYGDSVCLGLRPLKDLNGKNCPYGGYWSPFGGMAEEGENPMTAAVRELKEETEIEIAISDLRYIQELNNDDCAYILYAYHSPDLIFPNLNFEHTEAGYFSIDTLHQSPNPMCSRVIKAIKRYESARWKMGN